MRKEKTAEGPDAQMQAQPAEESKGTEQPERPPCPFRGHTLQVCVGHRRRSQGIRFLWLKRDEPETCAMRAFAPYLGGPMCSCEFGEWIMCPFFMWARVHCGGS